MRPGFPDGPSSRRGRLVSRRLALPYVTRGGTGEQAVLSVSGLGGVSVVNVASGKLLAFVPITRIFPPAADLNAGPLALNSSGTAALVLNSTFPDNPASGTVAVINTRTLRVTSRIRVGTEPTGGQAAQQRAARLVPGAAHNASWCPALTTP
jgi:YVTN family beta-propeller protein